MQVQLCQVPDVCASLGVRIEHQAWAAEIQLMFAPPPPPLPLLGPGPPPLPLPPLENAIVPVSLVTHRTHTVEEDTEMMGISLWPMTLIDQRIGAG